jgi:methanogenic corrinoid protein MtbC1
MSRSESDGLPRDCFSEWIGIQESLHDFSQLADPRQLMRLSHVIEGEIIPRLMMLHDSTAPGGGGARMTAPAVYPKPVRKPANTIDRQMVREFVELLLRHDASVAVEFVQKLRDSGVTLPSIYLGLLAPAARRLGDMWERDECDFTMVTIGTSRMHQVLLRLSPSFRQGREHSARQGHTALIVPLPGEQHTFGLHMVVEFFRRKGWDTCSGCPATTEQLIRMVGEHRFDVIGCSVSAERHLERLARHIVALREHSKNRQVKILVGGRLFNESPGLCSSVGADATAEDGECAVRLANALVRDA